MSDLVRNQEDVPQIGSVQLGVLLKFEKSLPLSHNENKPMQYLAIFHGCKNDNFQMQNCDIFLIFAQNIDCGYTLELPQ